MTDSPLPKPGQPAGTASDHTLLATPISGGVGFEADRITIDGDVVGRDKLESAGGHIIHAAAGATVIVGERPAPEPEDLAPAPGDPPFKGLQFFDEADADLFFGREMLTAKLVGRLREQRFLAIIGASGSGKSSIVRAGLIATLQRGESLADGALPPHGSERWPVHLITPTSRPLEALAASLTRDSASVTATATLMQDLAEEPASLHLAALRLTQKLNVPRLLLVVDQSEEIFTLCKDEDERKAFIDNLFYATEQIGDEGPIVLVLTLRADFYAHCARYDNLREALAKRQEFIGSMNADDLRCAIEAPAKLNNWGFEPGLVDLFLRDVGNEPGAMPLLSHALLATWKRRRGRTLTLEGYHESGGVHGAIARTAETIFNQFKSEQQSIVRHIFLRLTELGEGTQDTRRRVALSELMPHPEDAPLIEAVLKTLADARLVTTGKDTAEVAHEALIREWPTLRKWLDEDREGLRLQRQLTDHAREWIALNRDPGALYRGARLDLASDWTKDHPDELNPLEREFLEESVTLRQHEQAEREATHQKELDDARRLADMAEARARAERRVTRMTRAVLGSVTIVALAVVGFLQSRLSSAEQLLQQARGETVVVPAGEFALGTIEEINLPQEREASWRVTVPQFRIEKYEVTNAQYRLCVREKMCSEPTNPALYAGDDKANLPVVAITLRQAMDYCQWIGRRIPTEIEWEWAAKGAENWKYPTGNEEPAPHAINANTYDPNAPPGRGFRQPVDSVIPDRRGTFGMAGNVQEWTVSFFLDYDDPTYRTSQAQKGAPSSELPADRVVARGGSYMERIERARSIARHPIMPTFSDDVVGFRCVEGGS